MSSECPFCCDTYTEHRRYKVTCPKCEQVCCSECFKNFFLKGEELQLKCPFECDHNYDPAQLHEINGNNMSFFKKLLSRLTQTNLIYEESLLLETQIAAKHEKDWRAFGEFKKKEREEIAKLQALIKMKKENLWRMESNLRNVDLKEKKNEYTFVKECAHENCRGNLNTQWKCSLCENYTCPHCHEAKNGRDDPEHVCNEDMVKNLEVLKKESKPCPKCGTAISKIDGCDQMYCISCHTAFSWRRGTIETGYIHNPEYFRYRRENNLEIARNPADIAGEVDECFDPFENYQNRVYTEMKIRQHVYLTGENRHLIVELFRFAMHITRVDIPMHEDVSDLKKRNLRIKYLLGDIDKDKWHTQLKKIIKEKYINTSVRDLLITLRDIVKDIITNIIYNFSQGDKAEHNDMIVEHMKHFKYWYNKQNMALCECSHIYGSKKIFHYAKLGGRYINSTVREVNELH